MTLQPGCLLHLPPRPPPPRQRAPGQAGDGKADRRYVAWAPAVSAATPQRLASGRWARSTGAGTDTDVIVAMQQVPYSEMAPVSMNRKGSH